MQSQSLRRSVTVNNTELSSVIEPDQTCSLCVCVWTLSGIEAQCSLGPALNKGPLSGAGVEALKGLSFAQTWLMPFPRSRCGDH